MTPTTEQAREALRDIQQFIREVDHAQSNGANWYTRGEFGLFQSIRSWSRKANAACKVIEASAETHPDIERLMAAVTDFVWLIEVQPIWDSKHGPSYYWSAKGNIEGWGEDSGWTNDPNEAVRFARKQDAERVINYVIPVERRFPKAVEHGFDSAAANGREVG